MNDNASKKILRFLSPTESRATIKPAQGIIEGYPIVFETRTAIGDLFYEEISADALDGADMSDIKFLVNHDDGMIPLARHRRGKRSTMDVAIDKPKGLYIETRLDVDNNAVARALCSSVKRGDVEDMSFAFGIEVSGEEWRELDAPMPIRRITKISRVFEVSAVSDGAYPQTEIYTRTKGAGSLRAGSLRAGSAETLENEKKALENARSAASESEKKAEEQRQAAMQQAVVQQAVIQQAAMRQEALRLEIQKFIYTEELRFKKGKAENMETKKLIEERQELLAELAKPETTAERFAEIRSRIEILDYAAEQAQKKDIAYEVVAETRAADLRAARLPAGADGIVLNQYAAKDACERAQKKEETEKRAKTLKEGGTVEIKIENRAAVASSSTALGTVAGNNVNPAFEQVGTLDKRVNEVHLEGAGAESYKKPFIKSYGDGEIVSEGGTPAGGAEPTFAYAQINKVKIVAYAEVNEEVEKLPAAAYVSEIDRAVVGAYRKKLVSQIINGTGSSQLVGIVNAPATIIEASQRKTIATIDENTLDNIIFDYGGDESVEGDATLILNKLTLKEFAKVKGTDKRRAYDIILRGDEGTINGIPFVCTSNLAAYGNVAAGKPYMLYGKLCGYELAYFTNIEVERSKDYKFKEGVTAYKVVGFVGGSPAMWNGFMSVQKAAPAV